MAPPSYSRMNGIQKATTAAVKRIVAVKAIFLVTLFIFGPDAVHPVHAVQQGGLVTVRTVAGDPEPDSHEVAAGKEALQVRVRAHQA